MSKTAQLALQDNAELNYPQNNRNIIINGDFRVNQRVSGVYSPGILSTPTYAIDRWALVHFQAGKLTFQQSNNLTCPVTSYGYTITVASSYTPVSNDLFSMSQLIEGVNTAHLKWGTSSAKPVTLSFWVQCSVAGTYSVALVSSASTYSYVTSFTVTSANVWQQITISIPGPTVGTWGVSNTTSLVLRFDFGSGSNVITSNTNSWQSTVNFRANGSAAFVSQATNATMSITAIQLEVGIIPTPFEVQPFTKCVIDCMRYFFNNPSTIMAPTSAQGTGAGDRRILVPFPVSMRTTPTITTVGTNITGWAQTSPMSAQAYYSSTADALVQPGTTFDAELYS
ncbi:hypothetical protein [Ralstonia phage RP13]|nr:hypothetical protein [Ralstonia phage RP13]